MRGVNSEWKGEDRGDVHVYMYICICIPVSSQNVVSHSAAVQV